jgi:hypothetical protein
MFYDYYEKQPAIYIGRELLACGTGRGRNWYWWCSYLDHILKLSLLAPGVVGEFLRCLDEHRPLGLRLQRVHGTREDGNLVNKNIKNKQNTVAARRLYI